MKRALLLVLAVCLLAGSVLAASSNFQDSNGSANSITMTPIFKTVWGYADWVTPTGGNNYIAVGSTSHSGGEGEIVNAGSSAMTYAAATVLDSEYVSTFGTDSWIQLLSSGGSVIYHVPSPPGTPCAASVPGRYEIKMSGNVANVYKNGVLFATSGALATNPYYIKFRYSQGSCAWSDGHVHYDDIVYGESENKYVLGLPNLSYIIFKDFTDPANSGFATSGGAILDSQYMSGTWSRGNDTATILTNESIELVGYPTGTVYATNYTGSAYYGTVTIDILNNIINAGAPEGWYALTIPGTSAYSNWILYTSNGATVSWSSKNYNTGDTGTVIYYVMSGGYWNTTGYNYKVAVLDAFGNFKQNTTITSSTGSVTHSWSSTDTTGVYYAWLIATDKTTNVEYILGSDYTELDGYVAFSGYVNNETGSVQSGANVSIVQGSTAYNFITDATGNYTTTGTGFVTGASLTFNITKTGYHQYLASLTPLAAKTIALNFTINSTSPAYTGLGIGVIARDGAFDGTTITYGYGRPIEGTTVYLVNTSNAESYTKITNVAGWCLCDEGTSCFLASKRPYDIWGQKNGYGNSANYTAVTK